jgi:hypothetical protein
MEVAISAPYFCPNQERKRPSEATSSEYEIRLTLDEAEVAGEHLFERAAVEQPLPRWQFQFAPMLGALVDDGQLAAVQGSKLPPSPPSLPPPFAAVLQGLMDAASNLGRLAVCAGG